MNREQAKHVAALFELMPSVNEIFGAKRENLKFIKAFAEGKDVQILEEGFGGSSWVSLESLSFNAKYDYYRIKPETVKKKMTLNLYSDGLVLSTDIQLMNTERKVVASKEIEIEFTEGEFE